MLNRLSILILLSLCHGSLLIKSIANSGTILYGWLLSCMGVGALIYQPILCRASHLDILMFLTLAPDTSEASGPSSSWAVTNWARPAPGQRWGNEKMIISILFWTHPTKRVTDDQKWKIGFSCQCGSQVFLNLKGREVMIHMNWCHQFGGSKYGAYTGAPIRSRIWDLVYTIYLL